jgi:predicted transposase YdaD
MAKTFDATTKELIESNPGAWLYVLLGWDVGIVSPMNAELSTITAEADSLLKVEGPTPWIAQIEVQSSYDKTLPQRMLKYAVLIRGRHDLPVRSVVLLLCPAADGPAMTGRLHYNLPDGTLYLGYYYDVVKLWGLPLEQILRAGLAALPLAPLADVSEQDLPGVIQTITARLDREATPSQAKTLWLATYLLAGLRFGEAQIERLFQGVSSMKESSTYQKILREGREEGQKKGREEGREEGRAEGLEEGLKKGQKKGREEGRANEARAIIKRLGTRRFGKPSTEYESRLKAINDVKRLEALADRILDATSWDDLFQTPRN